MTEIVKRKESPNRDRQQADGHAGRALSAAPMARKGSEALSPVQKKKKPPNEETL